MKALIVGLGLIGGSIAKSLKKYSEWTVIGCDKDDSTVNEALRLGVIDGTWYCDTSSDADICIICLSPDSCISFLNDYAHLLKKDSVVTDVCGVKTNIVDSCERICIENGLHFIGGHPMAGRERNGFKNSDENLFNRASYILTKTDNTSKKAVDMASSLATAINCARITITTPENHDKVIAFTSQIPHILAGAYVKSPTCKQRHGFSAGSFKDVSRVATVDENLWSELFLLNKNQLIPEIDSLINSLNAYKTAIENNDEDKLKDIIKQGRVIKENDIRETEKGENNA